MTRSMTTVERYMELRAKVQELDLLAEHIPPAVLAERFVEIVEGHMERAGFPVETGGIRERVGKIQEPHGPLAVPYPLGGSWPPPPGGTTTIEIPQGAPVEEVEEPPEEEPVEEEPEASGEPEKPCKDCGVTKPLSEFPRNGGYKDGHTNVCKPCTKLRRKKPQEHTVSGQKASPAEASASTPAGAPTAKLCAVCGPEKGPKPLRDFPVTTKSADGHTDTCVACVREMEARSREISYDPAKVVRLPGGVVTPPEKGPEPELPEEPVRFCSNGEECVAYPQLNEPTRMHPSNLDDVCFPCQEARRKFGRTGPGTKTIVRHSEASATREETA